jgi:5'-methylthioadenosine phosphorylase
MSNKVYDGPRADVGVIGGSGLYSLLDAAETVEVDTPFGSPSDPLTIGDVGGRRVAFLPRHGRDHRFPPHRVNYRANIWALRAVGARQVLGPCAVGSLKARHDAGTVVVPDQIVDRTWAVRSTTTSVGRPCRLR